MSRETKRKFPGIGLRIIKSAIAVALCYLVSFLRGNSGIVFYSQLAALWCMQVYVVNTRNNAIQRTIGTIIGALYGLLFLLVKQKVFIPGPMEELIDALAISLMLIAVLYDIREKMYLKAYVISPEESQEILSLVKGQGFSCFSNVIVDDMLVIYYEEPEDEVQKTLIARMRRSPYRNYVKRKLPETECVVYFMMLYPKEIMDAFYLLLEERGFTERLKVLKYESTDYPGYSYIKIYNRNATKENMTAYLKKMMQLEKTVTFGSIEGRYDYVVDSRDSNQVVHTLKKLYEPVKIG